VKGYTKIERPLHDILQNVNMPKGIRKQKYQNIMKAYKLANIWTKEHSEMFIKLKSLLISEPVLRPPCFDGSPFILTTDRSKDAFAGVLSQRITTTLTGGKNVMHIHPLGFASK
jgi:RNase H-like domain found in reverse transcriptase